MIDSFHPSGSFSLSQIEVISLWISKHNVLPTTLISSAGIWSIPGDLWLFSLSIASSTSEALESGTSGFAIPVPYQKLSNNRPLCANHLSDCHTFTVRQYILLPFKHQTNKPTAISAQHNQWQYKHNTAEVRTSVTAGSDLSPVAVSYIAKCEWNEME